MLGHLDQATALQCNSDSLIAEAIPSAVWAARMDATQNVKLSGQLDRSRQVGDRLGQLPVHLVDLRALEVSGREFRVEVDRLGEGLQRPVRLTSVQMPHPY